jgi:hypothetical protein
VKQIVLSLAEIIQRAGGVFVGTTEDDVLVFFNDRDQRYRSTMCLPVKCASLFRVRTKILSKRREYQRAIGTFAKET